MASARRWRGTARVVGCRRHAVGQLKVLAGTGSSCSYYPITYYLRRTVAKNGTFSSHSGVLFDTLLRCSQDSLLCILNGNR